ncbi:MAG: transcriptional repressor LexA [Coriobacteriales bacterium]|nr:transcriptional repressor LexA [Coriobacteriales bacterium]
MRDKRQLSKRQQEIMAFLSAYIRKNAYPPSIREIGEAVGLASSSSVHSQLNTLEELGCIRRDAATARSLILLTDDSKEPEFSESTEVLRNIVNLPLVGRVAAGEPILAEQNIEENLTLPKQIVGDTASFMLTVKGESMIEAGIYDGDYVVVREQPTANNGEIVVALIDEEATVKTFYKEADRIRLQPENQSMDPIYVRDVTILGKVVALLRTL